ncbi:MAG: OmpA family protein [Cohaesibacter sp.]|jgi:outer membrane protein OmpA-like peptidoglycan-associated protein|nr:OmpA family protein [Cohaesibacter sp.]
MKKILYLTVISLVASGLSFIGDTVYAQNSGTPTAEQIVEALLKRPEKADKITGQRSLFKKGKKGVGAPIESKTLPSISLKVSFEFDSDRLDGNAQQVLSALGKALENESLKDQAIEIVGHTDAKGSFEYNDQLSLRRAESVVRYVVKNFNLNRSLISAKGMGERMLVNKSDGFSDVNRRVEIRNITSINPH